MQLLKLAKKYIIDSQIYVSIMGTALAVFFMLEHNEFRWPTVLLIFITYFSGYLYTKYQRHKLFCKILVFNVLCGIFSSVLIFQNNNEIRLVKWLVIVVLGLLYNSSFLEYYIRKVPLLKVFYVGFIWALVNSWLILAAFDPAVFIITLLFITALVLIFDIRDVDRDDIITFPRLIGVRKTQLLAYTLIISSVLIALYSLEFQFAAALVMTAILSCLLIYFAHKKRPDAYFSFGVETLAGLPFLITILMK